MKKPLIDWVNEYDERTSPKATGDLFRLYRPLATEETLAVTQVVISLQRRYMELIAELEAQEHRSLIAGLRAQENDMNEAITILIHQFEYITESVRNELSELLGSIPADELTDDLRNAVAARVENALQRIFVERRILTTAEMKLVGMMAFARQIVLSIKHILEHHEVSSAIPDDKLKKVPVGLQWVMPQDRRKQM